MNVYHYKNCLKLNIWNSTRPEIDGHAICIFNHVTEEFRLFKFGTWGGLTWYQDTPLVEITEISEETRLGIIKDVHRRLSLISNEYKPRGSYRIIDHIIKDMDLSKPWNNYKPDGMLDLYLDDFFFIYDNYVGDTKEQEVELPILYEYYNRIPISQRS